MDLASYGLDARITWGLTMGGRFVEKTVDGHTFTQRWAADLAWTFAMDCSGGDCAQASSMAGIAFPCETTGTVEAARQGCGGRPGSARPVGAPRRPSGLAASPEAARWPAPPASRRRRRRPGPNPNTTRSSSRTPA